MELNEINKNLISSKSEQYVVGVESILRNDIKLSIEGFYKKLGDLFVESDTSRIISNNGSGYVKGIEVFMQKKMSDKLVGSISYSYSLSKRKDNNYSNEYLYKYDRTHNFNLISSYRLSDSWQIGLKYTYITGVPYTPVLGVRVVNGKHSLIEGSKNSERFPSYQQLDIRIDRTFVFKNWSLNLYMDIWNILNKKNIIDYVYDIGKDGSVSKKELYDFKIMPIAGISARF
jgi:outer membrane receptor for ferrienterochelin and colicin